MQLCTSHNASRDVFPRFPHAAVAEVSATFLTTDDPNTDGTVGQTLTAIGWGKVDDNILTGVSNVLK